MSRPLLTGLLAVCCLLAIVVGGVIATDATAERSIPEEAKPGDTVTFTTTIDRDHGGPVDYSEQFDPRFDHARITSITLDDDQFIPLFTEVRGDSLLVITNTLEAGTIEVTVEVGIPDDAEPGDQFEFDGDYRVETGTDPVPVTGDSVLTIAEPTDGSSDSNGDSSSGDDDSSGGSDDGASDDANGDDETAGGTDDDGDDDESAGDVDGDDETAGDADDDESGEGTDDQDAREPTDAGDSSDEDDAAVEDPADGDDGPVTDDSSDASTDDPEGDTDGDTAAESTQGDEGTTDGDDELGVSLVGPILAVTLVVFALRRRLE